MKLKTPCKKVMHFKAPIEWEWKLYMSLLKLLKCCDPNSLIWNRFAFTQAVKHLVYMGIDVRNDVLLTVETMCVTYRSWPVMDVLQGGLTQLVTQVWLLNRFSDLFYFFCNLFPTCNSCNHFRYFNTLSLFATVMMYYSDDFDKPIYH